MRTSPEGAWDMTDWRDLEWVLRDAVSRGLDEDAASSDSAVGALGGLASRPARAAAVARGRLVLCGWRAVEMVFESLGGGVDATRSVADGEVVERGCRIGGLSGPAGVLLRGERTALNILNRMSGIATATRLLVEAVEGTGAEILDTRKTTPGFRAPERYAVRCGGGRNHRFDLHEMAMFKDNHWLAAGGFEAMAAAVASARNAGFPVEVEIDSLDQLGAVIGMHPDRILLDNMSVPDMGEAVRLAGGSGIYMEASGGISLASVRDVAGTGVDGISTGSITHSAPAADISLDWEVQR